MDNQVRLLPAVIGAAAVIVILRLAAMSVGAEASLATSGTASAADAAAAAPAEATPAPATAPADGAPAATSPAGPATTRDEKSIAGDGAGQAQNKGEADVLHGLGDRRAELDARESELGLREQLLAATQKQVDEKIAELKEIQTKLDTMLAQRDDAQKAQLNALVKMYETMKPIDAAKIFERLDHRILADVAGGMKPAKVGPILAAMDAVKAQELTALLASRLVLPEPQRAADASAAPAVTPVAPAPLPTEPTASAPEAAPAQPPTAPAG